MKHKTPAAHICLLWPEQIVGAPCRTVVMGYVFGEDIMSQHRLIERVEGSLILVPNKRFVAKRGTATEGAQIEDIIKNGSMYMRDEFWQPTESEAPDEV